MGNISPQDIINSTDGRLVSNAMTLDLQEGLFVSPSHQDFTRLAQMFGKERYFPRPDGHPRRYGQQIVCESWVLGKLRSIEPDGDSFDIWRVSAYTNGCLGILTYKASSRVLCQWLCGGRFV